MKKGCNPYTKDNFPKQLTYRRCRVATSPGSKNFEAPTKLLNESVQKLPWEGGGVATFFQLFIHCATFYPYYVIMCFHLSSIMQHFTIKSFKNMLYNMNEKLKKWLHIMGDSHPLVSSVYHIQNSMQVIFPSPLINMKYYKNNFSSFQA